MALNNMDIERKLKEEISTDTPDILYKIKNTVIIKEKKVFRPKAFSLAALVAVLLLVIIGGPILYNNEYEYLAIDINPSLELVINRFENVIEVNYNNEDAYNIFKDKKLKNMNVDKCLVECYNTLYESNYLDNEKNLIIISGYGKNHDYQDSKLDKYSSLLQEECKKNNVNCSVEKNKISKDDKDKASENDISYGKLKLIDMILEKTDKYSFDDLKDLKMKELKEIYLQLD